MSINKIILLASLFVICMNQNVEKTKAPDIIPELTCGKKSPKKEKHCTKYGTGSEMLCCWVSSSKDSSNGACYLLPYSKADEFGIDGEKTFENEPDNNKKYWSCGNKANYINISIILILLSLITF